MLHDVRVMSRTRQYHTPFESLANDVIQCDTRTTVGSAHDSTLFKRKRLLSVTQQLTRKKYKLFLHRV